MKLTEDFEDWDGDEALCDAAVDLVKVWVSHKKRLRPKEAKLKAVVNKLMRRSNLPELK